MVNGILFIGMLFGVGIVWAIVYPKLIEPKIDKMSETWGTVCLFSMMFFSAVVVAFISAWLVFGVMPL
jgi:hypothetical protein